MRTLFCAAAAALLLVPAAAAAKHPHRTVDPTATASYTVGADGFVLSVAACGYDFDDLGGSADFPVITWTLPDGSTQSFLVGMWFNGCIDTNSLHSGQSGAYSVAVTQLTQNGTVLLEGDATVVVP